MDLAGGPRDVLLASEEGNKGRVDVVSGGPGPQADLNRSIGAALGRASGLEVDGGEDGLVDHRSLPNAKFTASVFSPGTLE